MKDNGTVMRLQGGLAWVRVVPKVACCDCSARAFCSTKQGEEGTLAVRNPLGARPGDEVEIEVPETAYSHALSTIFGLLLIVTLAGLALGYFLRPLRSLPSGENGLIGFLVGLLLGGLAVHRHFRAGTTDAAWPVVVAILKKGGSHG